MTDVTKLSKVIGRILDLTNALSAELCVVAEIEKLIGDQKERFDQTKAQIATAQQQLEDLNGQIGGAASDLARLAAERAAIKQDIAELDAERRSHANTLAQIKKKLEAA